MEHGKLEVDPLIPEHIIFRGEDGFIAGRINCITNTNAQRLVYCWNAFEKGGLVGDLLLAADEGRHECERVKMSCTCPSKDLGSLSGRIKRIEQALARYENEKT